jgi:protein-S-isoprenylcysteine O-methyltransferase Ste14
MNDTKPWWQSRTIWVNVIASIFAVLAMFHVGLPADLTQDQIVTGIMTVVAIVNVVLRLVTHKPIG